MARIIRFRELPSMPWKNGGGSTVEVLTAPQGATIADFDFRISVATVSQDGPFSIFPNIDRTLALVAGEGLTLHRDGKDAVAVDDGHPFIQFGGEEMIHATVNVGATMDFNVMTHRGRCRHQFEILSGPQVKVASKGDFTLLFVARGDRIMVGQPGATPDVLGQYDAMVLDAGTVYDVAGGLSTFFVVDIYTQACTVS